MYVFEKSSRQKVSDNFSSHEFDCKCNYSECRKTFISDELVDVLQGIRDEFGEPIIITSAYRCHKHQQFIRNAGNVKTAKSTSTHELGIAVDIAPLYNTPGEMDKLLELCEKYFEAIGIADSFLHVDLRTGKERRWDY